MFVTVMNVMILFFLLLSTIVLVCIYKPIYRIVKKKKQFVESNDAVISNMLCILKGENDTKQKAVAFVSLMELSYILVHTIVNQGNNYNDRKQTEDFCKFLNPSTINCLKAIEGKYE